MRPINESGPLPVTTESKPQINPTGVNLSEIRKQWAEGLRPNDTALDWILNSPDEIFCKRVERITEISPIATEEEQRDFAARLCNEALQFVQDLRRTVGGRPVTMDECTSSLAKGTERWWLWRRPARREALRIILETQAATGYNVPWIVAVKQEAEARASDDSI
jgi:hypothetical protein